MRGTVALRLRRKADAAVEATHPEWPNKKKAFASHQLCNQLKKAYKKRPFARKIEKNRKPIKRRAA